MSITTVGALITALQKRPATQRVRVLDEGSDTRSFTEYSIDRLVRGETDPGQKPTTLIKVVPR